MTSADRSAGLAELVERLRAQRVACGSIAPAGQEGMIGIEGCDQSLACFIRSFLMWEATGALADAGMSNIARSVVDVNELRICLPDETAAMLGAGYPRAAERAARLRSALNGLFAREHRVSLTHLAELGENGAAYLLGLEGTPRYVAARVMLLRAGSHEAPVDTRIAARLIEADIVPPESSPDDAGEIVARATPAGMLAETYELLQSWSDAAPVSVEPSPSAGKRKIPAGRVRGVSSAGEH